MKAKIRLDRIFSGLAATAAILAGALAMTVAMTPLHAQQPADVILHNGKVLTVDKNFTVAEAVAVTGNKITAVGTSQAVLQNAGPNTVKIDLKGRTVVPGLIDTHLHIEGRGRLRDEAAGQRTPQLHGGLARREEQAGRAEPDSHRYAELPSAGGRVDLLWRARRRRHHEQDSCLTS